MRPRRPASKTGLPWYRRDGVAGAALVLAVALAYLPVWWAGYVWDDDDHLTANPTIVGPLGFREIWTTAHADVSPLTRSTFWLEHALWGLAPAAVSPGECRLARRVRGSALAGAAADARARGVAGRGALGVASSSGGVSGVDHGDEEHGVGRVLPAGSAGLREDARGARRGPARRGPGEIRAGAALRDAGHGVQAVDGDLAGCGDAGGVVADAALGVGARCAMRLGWRSPPWAQARWLSGRST